MVFLNITDDAKDWATSNLTRGQVETNFNENFDVGLEHAWHSSMSISRSWYKNKYHDELLTGQIEAAKELGINLPSSADLNREWSGRNDPMSEFNGGHVSAFNEAITKLREKNPDKEWLTFEEIDGRADKRVIEEAKAARAEFHDVSERASTGGTVGGFLGMAAGSMSDPINIGITIATAPLAMEGLLGAMAINATANTVAETGIQFAPGGVRDFAREQGLTDEQVNAETGMALTGAAVGGAALTGVIGGAGRGLAFLGRKIASGSPMEARAAANTLDGKTLPPELADQLAAIKAAQGVEDAASSGLLNTKFTSMDGEQLAKNLDAYQEAAKRLQDIDYNPDGVKITPETVDAFKARVNDLDGLAREVAGGNLVGKDVDRVLSEYLTDGQYQRFRELVADYEANPKVLIDRKQEVAARLQKRMHDGMMADAEKARVDAEGKVATLTSEKAKIDGEVARLRAEAARDLPDPALLAKNGFDESTASRLGEINERLADNISKKERKALEAEHASIVESMRGEIEAAKARMMASASIKEGAAADFAREIGVAEKQLRQAGDETTRVGKIASASERRLQKLEANAPREDAEITAALEVLDEAKLVEANKVAYAELYASHPTINPSKLREVVGLHEWKNRIAAGETITEADIAASLTNKEAKAFGEMLDAGKSMDEALDAVIQKKSSFIKKESRELLERVARTIDEVSNSLDEPIHAKTVIDNMVRAADEAVPMDVDGAIKAIQDFIGDKDAQAKMAAFMDENLNMKVVDPDTGEVKTMADIKAAIDKDKMLADLLEACTI